MCAKIKHNHAEKEHGHVKSPKSYWVVKQLCYPDFLIFFKKSFIFMSFLHNLPIALAVAHLKTYELYQRIYAMCSTKCQKSVITKVQQKINGFINILKIHKSNTS